MQQSFVKLYLYLFLASFCLGLCACQNVPHSSALGHEKSELSTQEESTELTDQAVEQLRQLIDEVEVELSQGSSIEKNRFRNEKVKFWLDYFTGRGKERFQRYLNRGERLRDVVQSTLEESGVPNELYYLAMIESGFVTHAYSHARALGVWQFIRATGRRYGLEANYYIDERRDPIHATEAAIKYLTDLYNAFLSWELAIASYNSGELRVLRAIMDGKTRDYWEMSEQRLLPKETRNYVPKFIAANLIGRNPEKYGFIDPVQIQKETYPSVVAVEVPSPVRLSTIAKTAKVPLSELKEVNPHLRRGTTPPSRKAYEIWVPANWVNAVQSVTSQLK